MNFEIEHWPNYFGKHALLRLLKGFIKGWIVLSTIGIVLFGIYFFTHLFILQWLIRGIVFTLAISPFLPIISFFQRDRKNPSYAINKDGFLLNERGWNAAFFTWDEIHSIKEYDHPKFGKELHFEFVSYTKAINKPNQDKFGQSLSREYEIEKQPKKISNQLVKGDVREFIDLFIKYFNSQKNKDAVSEQSTPDNEIKNYLMTKEDAIKIAQEDIENTTKIQASINGRAQYMNEWVLDAYLHTVDHPVWVVFAENLNTGPFIDGVNEYSIVVSTKTRKVEDVRLI
jgi:hypothetical protein